MKRKKATRALISYNGSKILKSKRSISPVVATVLLIAIVVVLALIIFLWARGFITETIMKKEKSANQACEEVDIEVAYVSGELQIINKGNMPVYNFRVKGKSQGSIDEIDLGDENRGVAIGKSISFSISPDYDEIEVFPVILGEAGSGKKAYVCENNKFSAIAE